MANRKISVFVRETSLTAGDVLTFVRTSRGSADDANCGMEKTDFDNYILSITSATTYTTITIASGVTGVVSLGLIATYEAFKIEFLVGQNDDRFSGNIDFVYDNLAVVGGSPNGIGNYNLIDYSTGLKIEDAIESGGYIIWQLDNQTASSMTIKYRISESKPAI